MTKILHYLGPRSPLGAGAAGVLSAFVTILCGLVLAPPTIWIAVNVFGWWFRYWGF